MPGGAPAGRGFALAADGAFGRPRTPVVVCSGPAGSGEPAGALGPVADPSFEPGRHEERPEGRICVVATDAAVVSDATPQSSQQQQQQWLFEQQPSQREGPSEEPERVAEQHLQAAAPVAAT